MGEKNSNDSLSEEGGDPRLIEGIHAVAYAASTLLAIEMRKAHADEDADVYSSCLAGMAHIVRVFEGEEVANRLVNAFTNGIPEEKEEEDDNDE